MKLKNDIKSKEEEFDKITFENNWILDNIYCLKGNYSSQKDKENDFIKLLESNQTDFGFRKLLIFFDEDNILTYLIKVIKKFYQNQIFILIFTNKNVENFKLEVKSKLNKLKERKEQSWGRYRLRKICKSRLQHKFYQSS